MNCQTRFDLYTPETFRARFGEETPMNHMNHMNNMNKWNPILTLLAMLWLACLASAQSTTQAKVTAALGQLDALARQTLDKTGIPGLAVAVVYQDQVVYLKGFGVREVGQPDPVDPDTVFQIASVSKPIAATLVAALVGDGVVKWDDRIANLDPGFQLYDPYTTSQVTLRDLFAHRSGLPEYAGDLLEDLGYSREEILHRLRYLRPASSFRSGHQPRRPDPAGLLPRALRREV